MTDPTTLPKTHRIVILGAGQAGGLAAIQLRQFGFEGTITLVGAEARPPYQRPPLSKSWLLTDADEKTVLLKPSDWYAENGVDLRNNLAANRIDRSLRTVHFDDGSQLLYDTLIIATGSRPRQLPLAGANCSNVFEVRMPEDAKALRAALRPGKVFVLIGAGYIGLEVAAAIHKTGGKAIVIEREARVLARVASPTFAGFVAKRHVAEGVQFECGASVSAIETNGGAANSILLTSGHRIKCDGIVVGVGVIANEDIASAAGLDCDEGILVDTLSRTSDPAIYAIGDVAKRPVEGFDLIRRLESVPSAIEQARQVAMQLSGKAPIASEIPWFWSDQYDMKLQIAGLWTECDQQVVRKSASLDRFMVFHLTENRVRAVESCGSVADFMATRKLIAGGQMVTASDLSNPDIVLKSLL
jgi:3-phenylpropionate/trans-cinnamate dioxygenase ferredoxin reductase component